MISAPFGRKHPRDLDRLGRRHPSSAQPVIGARSARTSAFASPHSRAHGAQHLQRPAHAVFQRLPPYSSVRDVRKLRRDEGRKSDSHAPRAVRSCQSPRAFRAISRRCDEFRRTAVHICPVIARGGDCVLCLTTAGPRALMISQLPLHARAHRPPPSRLACWPCGPHGRSGSRSWPASRHGRNRRSASSAASCSGA
jgi:hypothetical protein